SAHALVRLAVGGPVVGAPRHPGPAGGPPRPAVPVAVSGVVPAADLMARRVPGAMLWGILASTAIGLPLGIVRYQGIASAPPSLAPTIAQLDIVGALAPGMVPVVLIFFFLALFDSVGTLVGVGSQAGLMRDGTLPRARRALLAGAGG